MLYKKNDLQKLKLFVLISSLLFVAITHAMKIKSTENQADYLIITNKQFSDSLGSFTNFYESQGLTLKILEIDSIYLEFLDTLSQQEAIRQCMSYILQNWEQPKPQFLLLVGDVQIVPSYKGESRFINTDYSEDSVSIDDHFAINLYEDDYLPDIAIGRWPVNTSKELKNIMDKTINFSTNIKREDYSIDFLGLADYRENDYFFEDNMDHLIENTLPSYYKTTRIHRRNDSNYYGTKSDLLNALNECPLFYCFYGHANPLIWSDSSIFYVDDIDSLDKTGFPFVLTTMTSSQRFDIPDTLSIVERLLVREECGSVASFASVGLCYASQSSQIIDRFYELMFSNPDKSIGEIIKMVKSEKLITSAPDDYTLRFALLGDPALKFPIDLITKIKPFNPQNPESYTLYQNYPNPFNPETTIRFDIPQDGYKVTDVKLNIYNALGQLVKTLYNEKLSPGHYEMKWNASDQPSGIYFLRLQSGQFVATQKMMLIR